MMCDRYWREGILLVERNLPDPHREGCADCQRAHASRDELLDALPLIGEGYTGDPRWQSNVWERLEGKPPRALKWLWPVSGAFAVACILLLLLSVGGVVALRGSRPGPHEVQDDVVAQDVVSNEALAIVKVVPRTDAMRSKGAVHVDDRLQISARLPSEIWVYYAGKIILQCSPHVSANRCTTDDARRIVDMQLSLLGHYEVFVFEEAVAPPTGRLQEDRAALERAGVRVLNERIMVQ